MSQRESASCFSFFVVTPTMSPLPVPAKILNLSDAVQLHHWCFSFVVDGNPEANISWLYEGEELKETAFTYTQFIPDSSDGSKKHGCLSLDKPTHINNGRYTLLVDNNIGV